MPSCLPPPTEKKRVDGVARSSRAKKAMAGRRTNRLRVTTMKAIVQLVTSLWCSLPSWDVRPSGIGPGHEPRILSVASCICRWELVAVTAYAFMPCSNNHRDTATAPPSYLGFLSTLTTLKRPGSLTALERGSPLQLVEYSLQRHRACTDQIMEHFVYRQGVSRELCGS